MIHRIPAYLLILTLMAAAGCSRGPALDGFLWYGDNGRIARFDLKERSVLYPGVLEGCVEVASDPLGRNYAFACKQDDKSQIRSFNLSRESPAATSVQRQEEITDPMLSPDGSRTLFRLRRSGDVFDSHLLFKDAGSGLLARRIGAACFGSDNRTVYLAQENKVAAHVMTDITHPEKMPEGGLLALITADGAVRDLDFSLADFRILVCAGAQVLTSDLTGKEVRLLFDSTDADLAGPLQLPYRARWSPDGTRVAILVSPDGNLGTFIVSEAKSQKRVLVRGATPRVGAFAWTENYPLALR